MRVRIGFGRCGEQAVDVGKQHQKVRAHHRRDAGRQAVIIAVADLGGGNTVVLVDDRDGLQLQQRRDGRARIEIAAAFLGVAERQQDLPGRQAAIAHHLGPRPRQRDLSDGCRSLAFLELQRPPAEAEHATTERDGAGGDNHNLAAAARERGKVVDERVQPGGVDAAALAVDQQRRADLDDDPAEILGLAHVCRRLGWRGEAADSAPAGWQQARAPARPTRAATAPRRRGSAAPSPPSACRRSRRRWREGILARPRRKRRRAPWARGRPRP